MGILPPAAEKYDFTGIGNASAAVIMALLLANPYTSFLTVGLLGKINFKIISWLCSSAASVGLVFLNVGAEQIVTAVDKVGFDGSFDNAFKLIDQINSTGHSLTPAQVAAIDAPVIAQFEKFAKLTRTKS